jgi:class 3 adenylate cyclase
MAMLREYAETKKLLFQQKRHLAFVAADVSNAARLKVGEDKLVIEHAFAEYRKFVERVLSANNVWKLTWQGETVLCAFFTIDNAVRAAQQVVSEMAWFNDGIHQLRYKFEVRCGVSVGDVVFPEDKRLDDLSDEALDLAIAMRNKAPANSVWVAAEALAEVGDVSAFARVDEPVSGQAVRAWRSGDDQPSEVWSGLQQSAVAPQAAPAPSGPDTFPTLSPAGGDADSGPTVAMGVSAAAAFPADDIDATIGPGGPRR